MTNLRQIGRINHGLRKLSAAVTAISFISGSTMAQTCNLAAVTINHTALSPNTSKNQLVWIDTTKYPQAICNDGSPAAFVIRRGVGASINRWLLTLQPGSYCYDTSSCEARWAKYTYNGQVPAEYVGTEIYGSPKEGIDQPAVNLVMEAQDGILARTDDADPDFWDATQVRVLYCSSDDFTGNFIGHGVFSPSNMATWNFNGRGILAAVIGTLETKYGLNQASEALLTGESSGAAGVYLDANYVASMLPAGVRFTAMADSGFYDSNYQAYNPASTMAPYLSAANPTAMQSLLSETYTLWQASGDIGCDAAATTITQETYACRDPSYLMTNGLVKPPLYTVQSNYDTWQLTEVEHAPPCVLAGNGKPCVNAKASSYDAAFAQNLLGEIEATKPGATIIQYPGHVFTSNPEWTTPYPLTTSVQQTTLAALFGLWYRDPCVASENMVDVTQLNAQ